MFEIKPHDETDKSFGIHNNELDFYMDVDYDDVNHERVDFIANLLVKILNADEYKLKQMIVVFDQLQQERWESEEEY